MVPVADTALGRLATVICYDMDFPALLRQAGQAQADLLLAPASDWAPVKFGHAQWATFRAIENGVSLVRPTREGLQIAVDHQGRVLASADSLTTDRVDDGRGRPQPGRLDALPGHRRRLSPTSAMAGCWRWPSWRWLPGARSGPRPCGRFPPARWAPCPQPAAAPPAAGLTAGRGRGAARRPAPSRGKGSSTNAATGPVDTATPIQARPPGWLDGGDLRRHRRHGRDRPGRAWTSRRPGPPPCSLCLAFGLLYAVLYRTARIERWHRAYFAAQAALVTGLLLLPTRSYDAFHFLLFILGMQAVAALPRRSALAVAGAPGGHLRGDHRAPSGARRRQHRSRWPSMARPSCWSGAFSQAWHQTEVARRRSESLLAELRAAQQQARDLAVVEERNRLAREVHDSVGHRLTVAVVQLEGAQRLIPTDPERAARMIGAMRDQMKEGLADLRRTVERPARPAGARRMACPSRRAGVPGAGVPGEHRPGRSTSPSRPCRRPCPMPSTWPSTAPPRRR